MPRCNPKPPIVYRRSIDHHWIAVVTLPSGRRLRRGTDCRHEDAALQYTDLLHRHVSRHAEDGATLLPPPR